MVEEELAPALHFLCVFKQISHPITVSPWPSLIYYSVVPAFSGLGHRAKGDTDSSEVRFRGEVSPVPTCPADYIYRVTGCLHPGASNKPWSQVKHSLSLGVKQGHLGLQPKGQRKSHSRNPSHPAGRPVTL